MIRILNNIKFLKLINLAIFCSILIALIFAVRGVFDYPDIAVSDRGGIQKNTVNQPGQTRKDIGYYMNILRKNPFGFALKDFKPPSASGKEKPGNIKLIGTVQEGDGEGYAVFMNGEGKQEFFRKGERVFSFGMLEGVYQDHALVMGGSPHDFQLMSLEEVSRKRRPGSHQPSGGLRRSRQGSFIRKTSEGEYLVDRRRVEEAINNPQQLMTDARLQPIFKGGRQGGFVLKEVKRNGLYYSLGLRNNDILFKINEYPITNPEAALQAFNALKGADEIVLNIERRGKKKTLRYYIR
ncbi:hypothetical protein BMS3Bbin06_01637 [bacterium BMS3Bbin06]|nr:hypothetical protein BMS3Abin08_02524 [bacterium BMS3Abin08]GBE35101.1 hypothetical protein BMS3Bbin06_01637 [bacterium BMS3Bbin06]HDO35981.1 hypothetical protein [Nitrospirota bacterium]HDY71219.1 hypothetical protein [Nitrospirota bacterium]